MSGAAPEKAGIVTASESRPALPECGGAIDAPASAPNAEMHDMVARHAPDTGASQGAVSDDAVCSSLIAAAAASTTISDMAAICPDASARAAPAIGCIPGTTHTAPLATMLR